MQQQQLLSILLVLGIDVVTLRGLGSILLDTRGDPMLIPIDAETPVHAARAAWSPRTHDPEPLDRPPRTT